MEPAARQRGYTLLAALGAAPPGPPPGAPRSSRSSPAGRGGRAAAARCWAQQRPRQCRPQPANFAAHGWHALQATPSPPPPTHRPPTNVHQQLVGAAEGEKRGVGRQPRQRAQQLVQQPVVERLALRRRQHLLQRKPRAGAVPVPRYAGAALHEAAQAPLLPPVMPPRLQLRLHARGQQAALPQHRPQRRQPRCGGLARGRARGCTATVAAAGCGCSGRLVVFICRKRAGKTPKASAAERAWRGRQSARMQPRTAAGKQAGDAPAW